MRNSIETANKGNYTLFKGGEQSPAVPENNSHVEDLSRYYGQYDEAVNRLENTLREYNRKIQQIDAEMAEALSRINGENARLLKRELVSPINKVKSFFESVVAKSQSALQFAQEFKTVAAPAQMQLVIEGLDSLSNALQNPNPENAERLVNSGKNIEKASSDLTKFGRILGGVGAYLIAGSLAWIILPPLLILFASGFFLPGGLVLGFLVATLVTGIILAYKGSSLASQHTPHTIPLDNISAKINEIAKEVTLHSENSSSEESDQSFRP